MSDRGSGLVRYQPVLPLRVALGAWPRTEARPFPLGHPRLLLTFSGTVAIHQAFLALALPAGATVLCPAYNCGHEIEPIVRLGLDVECYRVGGDLQADLADVEWKLRRGARAVLVTHYFGVAQPLAGLRALCDRHGAYLVEDCAHALLSDDEWGTLGRTGDVAVYSFRKTLPVPNGGAVLFNDEALTIPPPLTPPPGLTTWLKSLALVRKSAMDRARDRGALLDLAALAALAPAVTASELLERAYPWAATACYDPDDDDFGFDSAILGWGISPYGSRLLERLDCSGIGARRRHNYRILADGIRAMDRYELPLPEVDDHTCPLFLPVLVEERMEMFRYLIARRIYPAVWWDQRHPAVDWSEFPEAAELKDRVLALPVHQDLSDRQLECVLEALRGCPALPSSPSLVETR